jgi:hypothetical protein
MLSDDKISHMTHVLLKTLLDRDTIDITEDENVVRRAIKRAINAQLQLGQKMDEAARKKIESLSRHVVEGSPEWETLYAKYLKEEEGRHGIFEEPRK